MASPTRSGSEDRRRETAVSAFRRALAHGLRAATGGVTSPWDEDGPQGGRPAQLPPGHPRSLYSWLPRFWFWLNMSGRGAGKLLDSDTAIPTTLGWRRLGDLQVGEVVFDEAGKPVPVTAVYDAVPRTAWRLAFSDGAELVAGGEHLWITWTQVDRRAWNRSVRNDAPLPEDWPAWRGKLRWGHPSGTGPAVRDTDEIAATLTRGRRGDLNHSIPTCAPLELPERELPIDPYALGYWLGNGTAKAGEVTVSDEDAAYILGEMERAGLPVTGPPRRKPGAACATYPIGGSARSAAGSGSVEDSFHGRLRRLGVLNDKHVPDLYLWASAPQRLRLLQGLVDADGHVMKDRGQPEFCTTTERLARAVVFLLRSLGEKPTLHPGVAKLYGREIGPKWRIFWRPSRVVPVTTPRRVAALHALGAQAGRSFHRMVVGAEAVPVRSMRCITVASPHGLFLAGEAMVPTHNTRSSVEFLYWRRRHGYGRRIALVGQTAADVRDVLIEGESGLIAKAPRSDRPHYEPSKRRLTWPDGSVATAYSGDEPGQLRGPQHDTACIDEYAKFKKPAETLSNIKLGLRLSDYPCGYITTTPVPSPEMRALVMEARRWEKHLRAVTGSAAPGAERSPDLALEVGRWVAAGGDRARLLFRGEDGPELPPIVLVNEPMQANAANLAEEFRRQLKREFGGTRTGRQELDGLLLEDVEGALWTQRVIDANRGRRFTVVEGGEERRGWFVYDHGAGLWRPVPDLVWVVVAVDPAVTSGAGADETGIVVAALGADDHGYVLEDATLKASPEGWAARTVDRYDAWCADLVVGEVNNGGDLVESVLRVQDANVSYVKVHASRGKQVRAQPAASLYEQGKVHHLGLFAALEDEMASWVPGKPSPNRMDAVVWALSKLMVEAGGSWSVKTAREDEEGDGELRRDEPPWVAAARLGAEGRG